MLSLRTLVQVGHSRNDRQVTTFSLLAKRTDPSSKNWRPVGLSVAAVGWGANQFAPLLVMYRAQSGLSAAAVQATFGIYALGLIPGLLLGGPLSDKRGRRSVMLAALALSLTASILLVYGGQRSAMLFVGRLVAGIASGAAFSAGTAWIKELSAGSPDNPGARRSTIAMTSGFAVGPLCAGIIAQFAPYPEVLCYSPHLVLVTAAACLIYRMPDFRQGNPTVARAPSLSPLAMRRMVTVIFPFAPWVFGSAAIGLAYLPGLMSEQVGENALLFAAFITALGALAGIAIQPLARMLDAAHHSRLLLGSMMLVIAGISIAAVAAHVRTVPLAVLASIVLGFGYGACQVGGLLEVQRLAPAHALARVTASYQAVTYLGFGVPFALAAIDGRFSPSALLIGVSLLAVLTLALVYSADKILRSSAPSSPTESTVRYVETT
ncbi:MAG: MFS transporter [Corynebacteriales bacterium]|nr:MFS transporter [Mycobacteriales bacterium]